jgi:guanylate kinase
MLSVLSGPSGAGKGTLLKRLLIERPQISVPVSYTTRQPRPGEEDGVHYHFVPKKDFIKMIDREDFVEYAEVHGNFYGTSWSELSRAKSRGCALLEIDCQGAEQIKEKMREAVLIFIFPPSREALERRLKGRKTDLPEVIERRLRNADYEFRKAAEFDYFLVNDNLELTLKNLVRLMDVLTSGETPNMVEFANATLLRSTLTALGCT